MSWGSVGFLRMLGTSQEDLDRRQREADELRAWRLAHDGPPKVFEWTDASDSEGAPMTPPESPKGDGPDFSFRAWNKRIFADLSRGIEPCDTGFDDYDTWKSHLLSETAPKVLPTSSPLPKPGIYRRRRRPTTTTTTTSERVTRSKTHAASLFYELGYDGKNGRPLPSTSSSRRFSTSRRHSPHPTKTVRRHKYRSIHRIHKASAPRERRDASYHRISRGC